MHLNKSNPFILPKITGTSSESAIATGASNFAPRTTPLISAYLPAVISSPIRFPIYLGRTEKSAPVSAKTSSNIQKHTKILHKFHRMLLSDLSISKLLYRQLL